MNKNIAIKVNQVSKTYHLYNRTIDRLIELIHPLRKKYFKDFLALEDISFEIPSGETVGIIGKNGSGKSSILKLITGISTPSSGQIAVNGRISALLELGTGFNPELTGIENIYFNGTIMGFSKKEIHNKLDEIIKFADIGDFIFQPLKLYSSGMKARLGFSVAIHTEPDILIIDEALSVGDVAFKRKCYSKIESFRNAGKTILIVSHSENIITQLCTKAIVLSKGKKIFEGNADDAIYYYLNMSNNKKLSEENKIPIKDDIYSDTYTTQSLIQSAPMGAKINNIGIYSDINAKVNVLRMESTYFFRCTINLIENSFKDMNKIELRLIFKNHQGIIIAGKQFKLNTLKIDNKQKKIEIEISFINYFNGGPFLIDLSLLSKTNHATKNLHKLTDAYMFKSLAKQGNNSLAMINLPMTFSLSHEKYESH